MPLPVLQTPRLTLRPRTIDDLDACVAMDLDPQVHRYIFARPPEPVAQRNAVKARMTSGAPAIGGYWMVLRRDEAAALGWCALFPLENSGQVELAYRYRPEAWGQGIATEAARAVLDYGFGVLKLDPIVAVTHPENEGSKRVLAKLGFRYQGAATHYNRRVSTFRLFRASYLAKAAAGAKAAQVDKAVT
ncbi:MAG TPA: GNAT family N-acetyltransferase [Candidatus Sulfotelmatobacter sp.]|nr:GNAT family N-acetyltransferase [Candidatus Sulfotelmatobacter sp.]